MLKKICAITAFLLVGALFSACAASSTAENTVDSMPETHLNTDATGVSATETAEFDDTLPELLDRNELIELDGDLQFYHFDNDNCTVVYNDKNAWVFDYELERVVPIVDLDAMLAAADRTGRGTEFFEDVSIEYEFYESGEHELRIMLHVTSNTDDAEYTVYGFYTMIDILDFTRGDFRGYFFENVKYPGSDEPVVIYDVNDYEKLGLSEENWIYETVRAIIENDVPELEYRFNLDSGVLADWEGMVISDYSITNQYADAVYMDRFTLYLNVTASNVERYPAGEYEVTVEDGLSTFVRINDLNDPTDDVERELSDLEKWVDIYARSYGGAYPIEEQTVDNSGYMHTMIDLYGYHSRITDAAETFEGFADFCRRYFGMTVTTEDVAPEDVTNHGGHGGTGRLCEIVESVEADGVHTITVDFYADPMKSVIAFTHVFTVREADGAYLIESCERTYDSGLPPEGWSA